MDGNGGAPSVFISYSHADETWKKRFQKQLDVLGMEGILDVWKDRRIAAGDDWRDEIEQAIEQADVAVLLISADFLTSGFIRDEEVGPFLERRRRDGMRVIPILIHPCPWHRVDWLAKIQMRPADGREVAAGSDYQIDKDFASIAGEIGDLLAVRKKRRARPGSPRIDLIRLPAVGEHLLGREKELAQLDDAWADESQKIISLVAWGGVGKSALTKHWLDRLAAGGFDGADAVYAWSFFSQGTNDSEGSADEFFDHALRWFGENEPEKLNTEQRAERLAELVQSQKTLLILDGLEPLQHEAESIALAGELKDRALSDFLERLSWQNPGLCLITTRVLVEDIRDRRNSAAPVIALDHLSDQAGGALLKVMGIEGEAGELEVASRKVQGHGLALNLLATYLRDFCDSDIRRIDEVDLFDGDLKQGEHARRIMAAYERAFADGPERAALYLLGFFDRPVQRPLIDVLRQAPVIEGLNEPLVDQSNKDWRRTLTRLEKAGLLNDENRDELDAHPLVREHCGAQLKDTNEEAWKAGHLRLYEYLKAVPKKHQPDTLDEMAPLFQAVHHGCQAGRRQEALDEVYFDRISRGAEFYSTSKLGAFGADLGLVASFFDSPFEHPANDLVESARAWLLNQAAFRLRALGRLGEAVAPMQAGLGMVVDQEDWEQAAIHASNLSQLQLTLGQISATVSEAAIKHADRSGNAFQRLVNRATIADARHQAGDLAAAQALFEEAEALQAAFQPYYPHLYSDPGYRYCDLLLTLGQADAVRERALEANEIAMRHNWPLEIALDRLSLGRAAMVLGYRDEARRRLDQAVKGLREAGTMHELPRGLLARASFFCEVKEFTKSRGDLDEAMRIAERGGMRLFQCDAHLGYARVALAEKRHDDARERLKSAKTLVSECGYHRRDGEVEELEEALA
ncbi:MAG: toll/interleukin-1 receptor domain-containing protein [Pseudomonadota bacterium]